MRQMKKLLLMALLLLCSISMNAKIIASGTCGANLTWELSDEGLLRISGVGEMFDYYCQGNEDRPWGGLEKFIKTIYIEPTVTSIGLYAFMYCDNLTSVTIPESVKSIASFAFEECSSLSSITIPNGVEAIARWTFAGCSSLSSITVSQNLKFIGDGALQGTAWYDSQPNGLVYLGNVLYGYKGEMPENAHIVVREGTVAITGGAFENCTNLTSITIPKSVTDIGANAFQGTAWYENQPDGLIYINNILYKYKGAMPEDTHIEVKDGTISISGYAFLGCNNLTSITIPEGIVSIGIGAFDNCSNLTALTIPETVVRVGSMAFSDCSSLESIIIPKNVKYIGINSFIRCSGLTSIEVVVDNPVYDSRDECNAIVRTNSNTLIRGCTSTIIPKSVNSIAIAAFESCGFESIKIPEGVTTIGFQAFAYCKNLVSIVFPESVIDVSWWFIDNFDNDNGTIWYKNLPEGVIYIGKVAYGYKGKMPENTHIDIKEGTMRLASTYFRNSNLRSINLPTSIMYIENHVFWGCKNLASITCEAIVPPTIKSKTFEGVDKSIPVCVPASSVAAYQSAPFWNEFTNIQPITKEFTLTVSSAGYATMYLDYAVEIPKNAEVYIATSVEDDRLKMTRVTGVLPANTGVIVRAKAGTYTFIESTDTPANVEGNLLSGTAEATYITAESGYRYYVLSQKEGMVGMYRPKLTDGRFLNNANKAYLRLESDDLGIFDDETNTEDEGGQLSNRLRFDFGGTTEIEQTTVDGGQTMVIYDLTGRRVADTEGLKGVYIVGGKKVIF